MRAAATSTFSAGGYPMSEVRGRSREDPIPKRRRPRGVTPCPRSGAAAKSARLQWRRNSGEELPHVRGQGQWPRVPGCDGAGTAKKNYPTSEVRGGGREEQPPPPRSGGCVGAGGPKGAIPHSRSGGVAVRKYPSSKVRSSGCTLLEQP